METMREVVLQELNELRFNRKHIDVKIRDAIEANPDMMAKVNQGITLIQEYINKTYSYTLKSGEVRVFASKMARIAQLKNMDIPAMVMDILVGIAYCQRPELFTSVSAQLSSRLKLSDRTEAIATVAELMAVLCQTDAFDISKENKIASLMVVSLIPLEDALIEFIENSKFLPPMVCSPLPLEHNYSSGYLTHNDSLLLGSGNHHDGDLCLDVLNTMNSVALKLDTQFLSKVEEEPSDITLEKIHEQAAERGKYLSDAQAKERVRLALEGWDRFKRQSYGMYSLMAQQGNTFYFNHKVDKRGRIYSYGHHLNPQGASFKKAMLEFAHEELVEGVPC